MSLNKSLINKHFDYNQAFSRNIGWLTESEQHFLKTRRVAIAGMGGVGGSHLLTHCRLGVEKFNIADFDRFELANFNRQAGATLPHLNQPKADTLSKLARAINPELDIKVFDQGISENNIDEFLEGVDIYIDGLDFFVLDIRQKVFARCYEKGIPAVTAAPLGMGAAVLNFMPAKMSFEEYFRLQGLPPMEQQIRFLIGLSPAMLQRSYLADQGRVDFIKQKGPSTPMACDICAGMAATSTLKILLNHGRIVTAPYGLQFDAYRNKMVKTWRPWGNNNPIQRLVYLFVRQQLKKLPPESQEEAPPTPVLQQYPELKTIIEYGHWAPSGDNMQPWTFKIIDNNHFDILGSDTRNHCVYDLQGRASQLAIGMLLENLSIGASTQGKELSYKLDRNSSEDNPVIHISLNNNPDRLKDALADYIPVRTVNRRALSLKTITAEHKQQLEQAVSPLKIQWFEGRQKLKTTQLFYNAAGIRLRIPEAYPTHKSIIEWNTQFSRDKMPDQCLGASLLTLKLMKFALQDWKRVDFLNKFLAGTLLPRLEMDIIPGLFSGAHFIIYSEKPAQALEEFFEAGRRVQRFWLTATSLGIQLQPQMTPLIFAHYNELSINFTHNNNQAKASKNLTRDFAELIQAEKVTQTVFMGRIGYGAIAQSRSIRKNLNKIIIN